jgi:uncharacterized membrane protein YphA (DoxX/SURF4 family)
MSRRFCETWDGWDSNSKRTYGQNSLKDLSWSGRERGPSTPLRMTEQFWVESRPVAQHGTVRYLGKSKIFAQLFRSCPSSSPSRSSQQRAESATTPPMQIVTYTTPDQIECEPAEKFRSTISLSPIPAPPLYTCRRASHMESSNKINSPYWALRVAFGAVPFLAGLDKFFNLLTNWEKYMSPLAARFLPVTTTTFMHAAGVIEMAVGIAILTRWTRLGSYVAAAWLLGIAANLMAAGFLDVAVRDVVMAIAAFTLAQLSELRAEQTVPAEHRSVNLARAPEY